MQVVILCGGKGTRLKELTENTPKPLIPIGGRPMVWHIMRLYIHYGFFEFILPVGYKQEAFKQYFMNAGALHNDIRIYQTLEGDRGVDLLTWREPSSNVIIADTGLETLKGARLKRIEQYIDDDDDTFLVTYGDGLADVNIAALLMFHEAHGGIGTITGVHPRSKFGELEYDADNRISRIREKPKENGRLTNGGFMVFNKKIFNYLYKYKNCDLEVGPLEKLAQDKELFVYPHDGFWKNADTLKDIGEFQELWDGGDPPWKVWS